MLELSSENTRRERSWAARLRDGLTKTRSRLSGLFTDRTVDPALFEEIETALLASDAGVEATRFLLAALRERRDLDLVLLPAEAVNDDLVFMDDLDAHALAAQLPMPIKLSYDFADALVDEEVAA